MSPALAAAVAPAALSIIVKATVLLAVAGAVQVVLRRRSSASTRHLVWTLAIMSVLLLPVASLVLPEWILVVRTVPGTMEAAPAVSRADVPVEAGAVAAPLNVGTASPPAAPRAPGLSWTTLLVVIYVAGVIAVLMHLAVQHWMVRRSVRRATAVRDAEWTRLLADGAGRLGVNRPVRLLLSREHTVPSAVGIRRSSIMVPAVAELWTHDRRRAVILHEMAHVARFDCLTQTLACAACAMYWFHPAAWWAARQLRIERELACDDSVIAAGTLPREYANHLLEIAYSFGGRRTPAVAVGMARPRELEGRMLAALDDRRNRNVPAPRLRLASATTAAMLLFPLATVAPTVAREAATRGPDAVTESSRMPTPASDVRDADPSAPPLEQRLVDAAVTALGVLQEGVPGTWELRPGKTEGMVHLRLVEMNSSFGSEIPIDRLEGLTAAKLAGPGGPIEFRLKRDAGTFTFEGNLREGVAAGTYSFAADPAFPAELEKRGFARPTAREQYQLARHDIGYAFLDELDRQGYAKPETSELVRAGQHGVQVTYLRDMGALGYRLGSLEPLITLRDHGVTPAYVRALQDAGYKNLSADDLRRARDHGVTPEYVRAMRDAGYGSLPIDDLIKARDHGVTADYLQAMRDAGYGSLPLDEVIRARDHGVSADYLKGMRDAGYGSLALADLINARDHGVTPEFVGQLGESGYKNLPIDQAIRVRDHGVSPDYVRGMRELGYSGSLDELVRTRDHGVSVDFVRAMTALGYKALPLDELVRLRDHGVTPDYVREIKALGYDNLTPDDLVTLRDNGLTPEKIRDANTRAGTRLPVDLLKSLARGGM
jgi:beta-lactamase regulating signal transducer with metallopeptidase domain